MPGNIYKDGVSDWNPPESPSNSTAMRDKLMSTEAKENPDNVSATNKMEQYKTGKSAGAFGTLGRRGIGDF